MKTTYFFTLDEMMKKGGENDVISLLSTFHCPKNPDVKYFLHHNAINFSKQKISITYLVFIKEDFESYFVGYFSLTNKIIQFNKTQISNRTERLVKKFGDFNPQTNTYSLSTPLIAQFGKNYYKNRNLMITGAELMQLTLGQIKYIQSLIGGRAVYLECENNPYLLSFYQSHGYSIFGKRPVKTSSGKNRSLFQLVKFFK